MSSQNKQDAFASLEIEMMSDLYNRWHVNNDMWRAHLPPHCLQVVKDVPYEMYPPKIQ